MVYDVTVPLPEILNLCSCPVNWQSIDGFGDEHPDALEILMYEWVRKLAEVSVSIEELKLVENVLFDPATYEPEEDYVVENLRSRRELAAEKYVSQIGRLASLHYLRPSEHGKHFSISGPKLKRQKISHFYIDWQHKTLSNMFWSWFNFIMVTREKPFREGPIDFLHDAAPALWSRFCSERTIRIAWDTGVAIGERNGVTLMHFAMDLDLASATAHGYPVARSEAEAIMNTQQLAIIKPRE